MHTLLILRHAKSDWPPGVPDHDRPLGARGIRDAPQVGRWLLDRGLCPQLAAVSTATRTRQTWTLVAGELGCEVPLRPDERIYAADWEQLLDVVRDFPEDAATAALVGHNPGCEELAAVLAGDDGDAESAAQMALKYPTAGVAVLELPHEWSAAAPGSARLSAFAAPRG